MNIYIVKYHVKDYHHSPAPDRGGYYDHYDQVVMWSYSKKNVRDLAKEYLRITYPDNESFVSKISLIGEA